MTGSSAPGSGGCSAATPPGMGAGMSAQGAIDGFANQMAALQQAWTILTPAARQAQLQAMIDQQATAAGFAAPDIITPSDLDPGTNGEFRFDQWKVAISPDLFDKAALSVADARQLGDTVYHETRHCEQWYAMAQRQAGDGMSDADIASTMQIPEMVAMQAAGSPLASGDPRRAFADQMYDSVYGVDAAARNQTLGDLSSSAQAYDDQVAAVANATDPAAKAAAEQKLALARTDYREDYRDYRTLPEEVDAWDSGTRAGSAVGKALGAGP